MIKEIATTYIHPTKKNDDGKELVCWSRNKLVDANHVNRDFTDKESYCSLFTFSDAIKEYLKVQGTVTGFNGLVWCESVMIDIDNTGNLELSRTDTISAIKKINSEYGVALADMYIYFSGSKGFHLELPSKLFGEFEPSSDLPTRIELLVKAMVGEIKSIDYVNYEPVRQFRIVNSWNRKSGLYKIEISFDELNLPIEEIQMLAAKPRNFIREKDSNSVYVNEKLKKEWEAIKNIVITENKVTHEKTEDVGFWQPANDGNRHKQLYRQCAQLFDHTELSKSAIYAIMDALNQQHNPPITDLKELVESAFKKTSVNQKRKSAEIIVKPFSGWVDDYINYLFHPAAKMTTGFESFDKALKKRLKGKLGCVVGYGGSKKSLFALNSTLLNVQNYGCVEIYSTMEMSANHQLDRVVDYLVDGDQTNASYEVMQQNREWAQQFIKEKIVPVLDERFYLSQNTSLEAEHYHKMIERVVAEKGRIDALTIDGLSMMGGKELETERFSRNSKELKELANHWNIYIRLICHVSKGADKTTRDLSDKVRGSEKIFDNCDFIFTMSQILDTTIAPDEVPEYRNDKGYIRFYDKRGSGITINKIFDFNPRKLTITESDEPTSMYESKSNKKQSDFKKDAQQF